MKKLVLFQIVLTVFVSFSDVYGQSISENWPTWRGPGNMGIYPKGNPPLKWSETENIKWKVKLTGDGSNSSPVIWKDRIFFQTAVKTEQQGNQAPAVSEDNTSQVASKMGINPPKNIYKFNLVCLDKNTGKMLWEKTVCEEQPHQGHHADHGYASFSPVTDGKFIWASFGSRGIYCYDINGNKVWNKELIKMKTMFGEGGSPALAGEAVIVVADHEDGSYIFAFDKNDGDLLWKKQRDEPTSYATPIVVNFNNRLQVIVSATNRIRSYNVEDGSVIWECGGQTRNVIPTPVLGFDMVFCTSGFRGSALQAIKLGKTGDLTGTEAISWEVKEATPYVPSPILHEDKVYVCSVNDAVISCYNAKTGNAYYVKQKLEEIKGIYASPVAVSDRIYFVGRNGVTYVLKNSDKLEVLAVNKLDDKIDCSPAIAGDEIFLKGKEYMYCISASK